MLNHCFKKDQPRKVRCARHVRYPKSLQKVGHRSLDEGGCCCKIQAIPTPTWLNVSFSTHSSSSSAHNSSFSEPISSFSAHNSSFSAHNSSFSAHNSSSSVQNSGIFLRGWLSFSVWKIHHFQHRIHHFQYEMITGDWTFGWKGRWRWDFYWISIGFSIASLSMLINIDCFPIGFLLILHWFWSNLPETFGAAIKLWEKEATRLVEQERQNLSFLMHFVSFLMHFVSFLMHFVSFLMQSPSL